MYLLFLDSLIRIGIGIFQTLSKNSILKESLIALKTILKEIDPYAFDQALTSDKTKNKELRVEQDPEERKKLDEKWAKLTAEVKKKHATFEEPDGIFL